MQHKTPYSKFIILVCNVPSPSLLGPKGKIVLEAVEENWKLNHPESQKFAVIFLHKDDKPNNLKFSPLYDIDDLSRIYIIGHCSPGSDGISSDNIYLNDENKAESYTFTFEKLGNILKENILNPNIACPIEMLDLLQVKSHARRLRICVPSCNSASDKNIPDKPSKKSFCYKLTEYLYNKKNKVIKCDVIGNTGLVVPLPLEKNSSKLAYAYDLFNFVFLNRIMTSQNKPTLFHKLHYPSLSWPTLLTQRGHQPNRDYKKGFIMQEQLTLDNTSELEIQIQELNTQQLNHRLDVQIAAEKLINSFLSILENSQDYDPSTIQYAQSVISSIEKGELGEEMILKLITPDVYLSQNVETLDFRKI